MKKQRKKRVKVYDDEKAGKESFDVHDKHGYT